jgi:hypothetical protein
MTFDTILFLGFPLSDAYQKRLLELSSIERELFIQKSSSPYLQEIENEGILYLGKYLGSIIEMAALETLSFHVYSLLKKLIPQFPYEQYPLLLFALPAHV